MGRFHPRVTVVPGPKGLRALDRMFIYHVAYAATDEETWDVLRAVAHARGRGCDCDAHDTARCSCGGRCGCHRSTAFRDPFKGRVFGIWFGEPKDTTDAEDEEAFREMFRRACESVKEWPPSRKGFDPNWYATVTVT